MIISDKQIDELILDMVNETDYDIYKELFTDAYVDKEEYEENIKPYRNIVKKWLRIIK